MLGELEPGSVALDFRAKSRGSPWLTYGLRGDMKRKLGGGSVLPQIEYFSVSS